MLTLFYSTGTCSTISHIALEEAGIPFEGIEVSWQRKVNLEKLAEVNPLGQVPVLMVDGRPLTQGLAILQYISDQAPAKNLLPKKESAEYYQALSWLSFAAADFQKSFLPFFMGPRWTNSPEAQADIKKATTQSVDQYLALLEKSLKGQDYILGNQFTLVDAYLFVVTSWCKFTRVPLANYPNLKKYLHRIFERPAVQKVLAKEDLLNCIPD